ncbi:hypothetical protein [Nocardia sp. alder85J]|uniref:hypothetical protein n=1 Tax=Nocardia sp. alder85J TaxID=2862949 RepID=UPI001CD74F35|nr:hypothetical protein [Nocardia sp. alder85J]MCX4097139.1 hypothetical protein [Nocardia sp. alder85J]
MRKTIARLVITGFVALALMGAVSVGEASAITAADCEDAHGIVVLEMDGTRECIGGFYNGLKILF